MKIKDIAKQNIRARREKAEEDCLRYGTELAKIKEYDELDTQIRLQVLNVAKNYDTPNENKEREKLAKLREKQTKVIVKNGYKSNCLTPQYSCALCKDTGKVANGYCKCLKEEIRRLTYQQCQIFNPEFTFENSDEKAKAFSIMQEWCEKYPNVKYENAVFCGKTGVGKTYLCSCIANALIEKEVEVLFVTSYNLNKKFLEVHTADIEDKEYLTESYEDVDVLIIDDLGTEPMLKNVTEEYLFAMLNQRLSKGKSTIISTNMDMGSIMARYGERIFSRLTDAKTCLLAELTGKDKRHK